MSRHSESNVAKRGAWRRVGAYIGRDVWLTDGRRTTELQHRVLVQEREGRVLSTDEHVHHRDEDKRNNSTDNLESITRAEHTKRHFGTGPTMVALTCQSCGVVFRTELKRRDAKTCSRSCAGRLAGKASGRSRACTGGGS